VAGKFTLEYWLDDDWYVGRLFELPQGFTLAEENIRDAYRLMMQEQPAVRRRTRSKHIAIPA